MSIPVDANAPGASDGEELSAGVVGDAELVAASIALEDDGVVVVDVDAFAAVTQLGDVVDVVVVDELGEVVVAVELGDVVEVVVDVEVVDVVEDVEVVDVEVVVEVGQLGDAVLGDVVLVVVDEDVMLSAGSGPLVLLAASGVTKQHGGSRLAGIHSSATRPPDVYDQSACTASEDGVPMHHEGRLIV
jgi:hypothetical protein